jgi:N-methylhydantoinase A
MADLMRQMTVERGLDPRDFVIYSFGGAGAAHAVGFARELGCDRVVVPLGDLASTWSALGVMTSDVVHVHEHAELVPAPFPPDKLNEIYERLEGAAREQLRAEGFAEEDVELSRIAEMKFSLQIHQVEVPVPAGKLSAEDCEAQVQRFIERYEQTYGEGSAFPGAGTQIGLFRVLARGKVRTPALPDIDEREAEPAGSREVYWRELGGFEPTDIHDGRELGASARIAGPAIVELPDTTIVVRPANELSIDRFGNAVVRLQADGGPPREEEATR